MLRFHSGTYAASMVAGAIEEDGKGHPRMMTYLKHYDAYILHGILANLKIMSTALQFESRVVLVHLLLAI